MSAQEGDLTVNNPPPKPLTKDDIQEMFREFARKKGSAEDGGIALMGENAELRADKRELKTKVEELERKVMPDGALVLTGANVKLYNDFRALLTGDQKVEDLAKQLKEHAVLTTENADLKKQSLAVEIAEAEGWKVSALLRLVKDMDLVTEEVEEETVDPEDEDKKVKTKVVRGFVVESRNSEGAVTTKKRLSEELSIFLPSLVKDEGQAATEGGQTAATESGTPYVRQSQGGKAASDTKKASARVVDRYKRKKAE